jgi:hypothetical protein
MNQADKITALLSDEKISAAAIEFADKIANNKTLMEKLLKIIKADKNLENKRKILSQAIYNLKGGRNRRTKKTKYSSKQIRSKRVNKKHITKKSKLK